MLTSLVITIETPTEMSLPANLGRASHQLLLSLLPPALATELHESQQTKPFTVSTLVMRAGRGRFRQVKAGAQGWLRFTGLTETVSQALQQMAENCPATIELDNHSLTVTQATFNSTEHPWAGSISYQDLAATYLLGQQKRPAPQVTLEFASPTTFRSQGKFSPLPQPAFVFGSLLNRWHAFAPITLSPEFSRDAENMLALNRFQLRSVAWPTKGGGQVIGFSGQASFRALNKDPYWLSLLHLLSDFAFYSGVGYQTTAGLGQCRAMPRQNS